jgi:RimJ/RimL family protein N-acetyltransferase
MAFMESNRARLRRLRPDDFDFMRELESDPDIMKFTGIRHVQTPAKSQARLDSSIAKEKEREPIGIWVAELITNSDFVGWFMLLKTDFEFPELGFMLVKRHWNQGLATEISARLLQHAWDLGWKKIVATATIDNAPSCRVLEKLGFIFQETLKEERDDDPQLLKVYVIENPALKLHDSLGR